jgi:hypothetical protein
MNLPHYRPLIDGELASPEMGDQRESAPGEWVAVTSVYAVTSHDVAHRRPLYSPVMSEKELETAARYYCRLQGLDPDESVAQNSEPDGGISYDVLWYGPRWRRFIKIIRQHAALDSAVAHGLLSGGDTHN